MDQLYLATAPHWAGPYTRHDNLGPIVKRPGHGGAEDPFVWRSKRGYHLLLHSLGGEINGTQRVGGMAYSMNGTHWVWVVDSDRQDHGSVYPADVTYTDGTSERLTRRQVYRILGDMIACIKSSVHIARTLNKQIGALSVFRH